MSDTPAPPPASPSPLPPAEPSTLCTMFRSRGMYQYAGMEDQVDIEAHDGEMWCLKSGTDTGPDGGPVSRQVCRAGRKCWETFG